MKNRNQNQRTQEVNKNFMEGNAALKIVRDNEQVNKELKQNENFNNETDSEKKKIEDEELKKEMDDFVNKKAEELKLKEEQQKQKNEEEQKQKQDVKRVLSVDERIQKIKELGIITDRRKDLLTSKNKLSEFAIGTTAEGQKLELIDSNKRTFTISNTEAIKGVIDFLKNFLEIKINEVEKLITFE